MKRSELEYSLPEELIAQHPAERRDESRLLVYERQSGDIRHRRFRELPEELGGELVVVNDTRVVPARLRLERPGGGAAEVLLLERLNGAGEWEGLARPTKKLRPGQRLGPVELIEHLGEGRWRLRLEGEPAGEAPLPPYITEPLADPERYQTVYARARRLGGRADSGPPLHARAPGEARRRARHAPRRPRHVPAGDGGRPRRPPDPHGALRGREKPPGSGSAAPSACSPWGRRPCACSSPSPPARRSRGGPTS